MDRKSAILNMRQILIKRRDGLRQALAGDLRLLKELRGQTSGDTEVNPIQDEINYETGLRLNEVEGRELTRIEHALERMRNGYFGVCEDCGTDIPMSRLNALPYATLCIKCQLEAERKGIVSLEVDWSRLLGHLSIDADDPPTDGDEWI